MALVYNTDLRIDQLVRIVLAIDAGVGDAKLKIYSAPRPATNDAPTGDLLVTLLFSPTAFANVSFGALTFAPIAPGNAAITGIAAWFRAESDVGDPVFDGSVGLLGSGEDLEMAVTTITSGSVVSVNSLVITAGNAIS